MNKNFQKTAFMKTKQLKNYPLQIICMVVTFFVTMLIPVLIGYLVDDIMSASEEETCLHVYDERRIGS